MVEVLYIQDTLLIYRTLAKHIYREPHATPGRVLGERGESMGTKSPVGRATRAGDLFTLS